jgi:hypothetical protein
MKAPRPTKNEGPYHFMTRAEAGVRRRRRTPLPKPPVGDRAHQPQHCRTKHHDAAHPRMPLVRKEKRHNHRGGKDEKQERSADQQRDGQDGDHGNPGDCSPAPSFGTSQFSSLESCPQAPCDASCATGHIPRRDAKSRSGAHIASPLFGIPIAVRGRGDPDGLGSGDARPGSRHDPPHRGVSISSSCCRRTQFVRPVLALRRQRTEPAAGTGSIIGCLPVGRHHGCLLKADQQWGAAVVGEPGTFSVCWTSFVCSDIHRELP